MEKQPHQEYRDQLAKDLKELRSEGKTEDAKITLDLEGGTREYREAKNHHIDDIKTMFSEKENQLRLLSAEERLDYVYSREKISENFRKEDVLEFLKLIDELIENGFMLYQEYSIEDIFDYFKKHLENFPNFGSKENYDINSLKSYLEKFYAQVRIRSNSFRDMFYPMRRIRASKFDMVVACDGDHDWGVNSFTRPALCECLRNEGGCGIEERVNKFYNFIQKFKKTS